MAPCCPTDESFDARRALRRVAVAASVGVAQVAAVLLVGRGLPCPVRAATGIRCPLCGTTTALVHLLQGDVVAAGRANALSVLVLGGLALCCTCWAVEAGGGPALRAPGRLRTLWGDRLLAVLGVAAVVFGAARLLA